MASIKVAKIRELHSHLGALLADFDARKNAESAGEDGAGSGLGAKTLEENDQPGAQDDPPETPGTPRRPVTNGNQLAASDDGSHVARMAKTAVMNMDESARLRQRSALDTRTPKNLTAIHLDAAVAARADSSLKALIPGYGRLLNGRVADVPGPSDTQRFFKKD